MNLLLKQNGNFCLLSHFIMLSRNQNLKKNGRKVDVHLCPMAGQIGEDQGAVSR